MLFSLFSVLFQNLEFIFKMLNRCSGKQGRGCSRFLAEWDKIIFFVIHAGIFLRIIPAMFALTGQLWSKSIKAISKLSRRTNLDKTGEKVQMEGASRESSRPLQKGNEAPIVTDQTVSDVEVPSSLALTAGSNLGAPLPECSTAGNGTGNSSQSTCRRESEGDSGNQHPSPEPKRRLRFQNESNPPSLVSTNTASGFSDFQSFLPRPLNPVLVIMLFTVYNRICGI